jgi:CheY-like chemotaxis protein
MLPARGAGPSGSYERPFRPYHFGQNRSIKQMSHKILLADDDPNIIKLLQVNLEMEGYEVITAEDGEEAVRKAASSLPDLVLLDVMMPKMDGWAALEVFMQSPNLREIPVILLSARAQQSDVDRGYEAGITEYVTKPFDLLHLLDLIEKVLKGTYKRPEAPKAR